MSGLHLGGIPSKVRDEIERGEQRTLTEWAKRYNVSYNYISKVFIQLRKMGHNYRPYQGNIRVGVHVKKEVIVDYPKRADWATSVLNLYEDNYTIPHLEGTIKMAEEIVKSQPQLAPLVQAFADRLQIAAIDSRNILNEKKILKIEEKVEEKK